MKNHMNPSGWYVYSSAVDLSSFIKMNDEFYPS